MSEVSGGLVRGLKNRHVQMIALGGAIGSGLFLGSAQAIHKAGPSLLLAYALGGMAVFFMARALGELLLYRPVAGSFATYAHEFVGPWAGFVSGWSYWFLWVMVGIAELTAVGVYIRYWFPNLPQWVPVLAMLGVLLAANLRSVKVFGEFEFWFALIKVLAVVALLIFGVAVLGFDAGGLGTHASVSNLWTHGSLFANGTMATLLVFPAALFAFGGIELIGVTAGEAEDPGKTLPRAINGALLRILVFYIGAIVVIMSLVPWDQISPDFSPFVTVFDHFGIPAAAGVINFVVLTAAASACNSGIFSCGRMLHTLANAKEAPAYFATLSDQHVPTRGIIASVVFMLAGVLVNYVAPEQAFIYVMSTVVVIQLWTWSIIIISHLFYRRAVAAGRVAPSPYRMPGAPWSGYLTLAFFALTLVLLAFDDNTRLAVYVAPAWVVAMVIGWQVAKRG
ncbi:MULTISPECIES: amino acid permease [Nitrospirillum]|uniref:D-serine/D-alanine/glycine:proton symporter (AAT family) n=1 Tax=Nitrospirillum amazonense TaxID=28077 RepID=A0A560FNB1_9PROT|nr:amino acid permease [Nitrospirillum amazonense]MEC4592091.1 amino acid permease [Nitrospirillum amazonense]TWB23104.1 D-serine/D-alanine/glycine:proton symporter (AAT family) [Nitrospirillum amazonense]